MAAKNKANVSQFVGRLFIRPALSAGEWYRLGCIRGLVSTVNTTNQTVDIITDDCGSIFKGYIPEASISCNFLENADTTAFAKLFGLTETSIAAGAHTITDKAYTFGSDDKLVLSELSNDGLGFTVASVKSSDGVTTYTVTTDYTVAVDATTNETTITRVGGGTIPAGASVLVTATGNVNASSSVSITSQFTVKDEIEVRILAESSTGKYRVITMTPSTLESDYTMEFLDVVKAGNIEGASLTFQMSEGGVFDFYDEILTASDV